MAKMFQNNLLWMRELLPIQFFKDLSRLCNEIAENINKSVNLETDI